VKNVEEDVLRRGILRGVVSVVDLYQYRGIAQQGMQYLEYVFIYFFKLSIRELYSSLVGGGNATFIGCQPPLNLIEEEVLYFAS
jgi:hypothetical protein